MSDKPWLGHYDRGVPHTLAPYPRKSMPDILREAAEENPDDPALLFKGAVITYSEFDRLSNAFACALIAEGVRKGDRVALLMPNSPQMLVAEFGVWKAGAIVVPINPLYTEPELLHALEECGAEIAVVLTMFYAKLNAVRDSTPVRKVIATNISEYLPSVLRLLFTLLKEKKEGHRITLRSGDLWMQEMIGAHKEAKPRGPAITVDDPAVFLFSGGTTGKPKCAIGNHHALLITGMQVNTWFGVVLGDGRGKVVLNMPLFHVYAQLGIFTSSLIRRSPIILVPNPKDIGELIRIIRKLKPAVLPGVPTLFNALSAHPELQRDPQALKSVKLLVSAASSLHLETRKRFEDLTGGKIIEAYGLTESMIASVCTPVLGVQKPGAAGIPVPDVEIRIVDTEDPGLPLQEGEVGEVLMRAPQLMMGYWKNPEESKAIIRDGWLLTGDLGYMDSDGYLFIVDRKKDVIKPGGFQVWPREVEEVIARHPSVLEAGVAGVPDDYKGEAVKAWIVLHEGSSLDAEEIRTYCRQELAAYKVPKHVEFCPSLPKSTIGKVLRRELVREHNAAVESRG